MNGMFVKKINVIMWFSVVIMAMSSAMLSAANYSKHPVALKWQQDMIKEGFSKKFLDGVLKNAKRQDSILKLMNRQAEGTLTWEKYRSRFIETKRIQNGSKFWKKHAKALAKAELEFGVPAEVIVSIIGVETRYGKVTGNYRVLDAIATIGFDYERRGEFFRNELKDFLLLSKSEKIDYTKPKGSYAGAMGFGQFIPSSFKNYAIDFDGDGKRDIWKNPVDAIGSVANYFKAHGWKKGEDVLLAANIADERLKNMPEDWYNDGLAMKVTLGQWNKRDINSAVQFDSAEKATLMKFVYDDKDQFMFGLHNFYVITRYNHSRFYAMVVHQLSQLIKAEHTLG